MSYLDKLKRAEADKPSPSAQGQVQRPEDDPVLSPDQWYREFHRFHVLVVQETPDLDWAWLREQRPELLQTIKDKEAKLDALGDAKLSEVLAIMREWRGLILNAEFERVEASKPQPQQADLNLKG